MDILLIILLCLVLYLVAGTACARLRITWWWAEFDRVKGMTEHMGIEQVRQFFYDENASLYKALREEKHHNYNPHQIRGMQERDKRRHNDVLSMRVAVHQAVQTRARAMVATWPVFFPASLVQQVLNSGIDKHDPVLLAWKSAEQQKRIDEMQKENERLEKELGIGKDED